MNVRLLRKVKKHILEEPKRLLMTYWRVNKKTDGRESLPGNHAGFASCGTAACIAGWAWTLEHPRKRFPEMSTKVAELLGINPAERFRLFSVAQWPTQFQHQFRDDGSPESAKVAAARIEHFIKTKGKE